MGLPTDSFDPAQLRDEGTKQSPVPHLATVHALAANVQARALERFYCDLTFDPSGDFVPTEASFGAIEKWRRIVTAGNIKPE